MTKKYFILFIFIFLTSGALGATLTMGPQQLDFLSSSGEINCQTATLKSDGVETLSGKVLFSEDGYSERKLTNHNLMPEDRGIDIEFPKEITINNKSEIEVCVSGPVGNYHGIILYKIKDKPVQVGIWIDIRIEGNEILSIHKNVAGKIEKVNAESLLVIMPIFWMIVLVVLLIIWEKKKN